MGFIEYTIAAIIFFVSGICGWFLRNRVLKQQLLHKITRINELELLHTNLTNELSIFRKKALHPDGQHQKMEAIIDDYNNQKKAVGEGLEKISILNNDLSKTKEEKDDVLKRLSDISADKSKLTRNKKLLEEENKSLRNTISSLRDQLSKLENQAYPSPKSSQDKPKKTSQSTERFKKKQRVQKGQSSTGVRLLEKFAEEIRDSDSPKSTEKDNT